MNDTKKCTKCLVIKNLSEFNKCSSTKDQRSSYCKECSRELNRQYHKDNKDKIRKRKLNYYHDNKEEIDKKQRDLYHKDVNKSREKINQFRKNNIEQKRCHDKVKYAVKTGKLVKPTHCTICKSKVSRIEAHHHDYSKPLDVVWCCPQCHNNIHREEKLQNDS